MNAASLPKRRPTRFGAKEGEAVPLSACRWQAGWRHWKGRTPAASPWCMSCPCPTAAALRLAQTSRPGDPATPIWLVVIVAGIAKQVEIVMWQWPTSYSCDAQFCHCDKLRTKISTDSLKNGFMLGKSPKGFCLFYACSLECARGAGDSFSLQSGSFASSVTQSAARE